MGDGALWPKLWAANREKVPNSRIIYDGQRLAIPEGEGSKDGGGKDGGGKKREPGGDGGPRLPAGGNALSPEGYVAARRFYDGHAGLYPVHVVARIQDRLGIPADGVIGMQFIYGVAAWQAENRLVADGIAGKATSTALFGRDIRHDPKPAIAQPREGEVISAHAVEVAVAWYARHRSQYPASVIRRIEEALGRPADGIVDRDTIRAIAAWQKAHGLGADGLVGPATMQVMFGEDIRMGQQQHNPDRDQDRPQEPEGGLSRPDGLAAIRRVFGEPGTNIVTTSMRAGPGGAVIAVTCHRKIAGVLAAVFADIHAAGMSDHIKSFDGCYCYRRKRGSSGSWSTHAWAIAVDVNVAWNPMVSNRKDMKVSGDQKVLVPFFEKHGFYWGGNFNDPMHFQYCTGY
jgi:peptidoglycan hydrolase-like protein with peptidoglycan-binding domain